MNIRSSLVLAPQWVPRLALFFALSSSWAFAQDGGSSLSRASLAAGPSWSCSDLTEDEKVMGWPSYEARAENPDLTNWKYQSTGEKAKGVVFMAHGIGLRPSRMSELAELYSSEGYDVLTLGLSDHTEELERFKKAQAGRWLRELFAGYCLASHRAKIQGLPLVYSGFSLGGLLGQTLINMKLAELIQIDRMLLFAPALELTKQARAALVACRFFSFLGLGGFSAPLLKDEYTVEGGIPLRGFVALNDTLQVLRKNSFHKSNIPTLVLIDPKDELVSLKGLKKLVEKHQLSEWKFELVGKGIDARMPISGKRPRRHMIVDSTMLGSSGFDAMSSHVRTFLRNEELHYPQELARPQTGQVQQPE